MNGSDETVDPIAAFAAEMERIAMQVLTERCAWCGRPATGYAAISDVRFCHGDTDPSPTCYERASQSWTVA